ncbi:MAG TPA: hypothetical protein ENN33_12825 [Ignavibacteria bacterium]|nr:hypothetical protein [Ignavibacteria bacterium]
MGVDAVFDGTLYNNYVRRFYNWILDELVDISYSKTYNFTIADYLYSHSYDAVFKKQFNITFQNNFSGGKI